MRVQIYPVGALGTNCYFLADEAQGALAVIDPGDQGEALAREIRNQGLTPKYILLTHGHYDHTTGVPALKSAFPQAQVYIHQADANGAGSRLFPLAGEIDDLLLYDEGDTLPLGSLTIHVLHTPGHSPGSVTLQVEDVLFTGDTLFAGSCGRTDLAGGSYAQIMGSLARLGALEGDFHVCPGHDVTSTLERERRGNPYLREALRDAGKE